MRKLELGPKVIAAVLALTLGGALVGALSNVAPTDRFTAEALIAIQHDPGSRQDEAAVRRLRWEAVADVARLPVVVKEAARTARDPGSVKDVRRRVEVRGAPGGSVLRVLVRGSAPAEAGALADALAKQTVDFLEAVNRRNFVTSSPATRRFSFEDGNNGWGVGQPGFSQRPRRIERDTTEAQAGNASLRAQCGPRPGCGPSVRLSGDYRAGTTYTATAFLRSPDEGVRVSLVLGTASRDVGTSPTRTLSGDWKQATVNFTPKATATGAELGVQTLTSGATTIFVDEADLVEVEEDAGQDVEAASEQLSIDIRASRAAAEDRYSVIGASTQIGRSEPRTVLWTLVGGVAGLLLALTGLAAAAAARSRRL